MSKQSEALRQWIAMHPVKQKEMAAVAGITESTMSNILKGRFSISKDVASKLADAYGFDIRFLLSGTGELEIPEGFRPVTQIASHVGTNTQVAGPQTGADCSRCPVNVLVEQLKDENKWLREQLSKL